MKYFLLKTDPQYDTYPQIIDWYKKIDHRNICIGRSHVIDHRQLFFIQENINTIFPDILSIPFFMVTDLPKDVIKMYEPKTVFKEIPAGYLGAFGCSPSTEGCCFFRVGNPKTC